MISMRKATLNDETAVFDLLKGLQSSQTPGESLIHTPASSRAYGDIIADGSKGTVIIAENEGKAVGVITLSYPIAIRCGGKYTCIEEFIVSEAVRGRGVGTMVLNAALEEAKRQGCFEVQVNNPSELGYPLYIRANMKDTGKHLKMRLTEK
ncbi:MAG: GNAT family N-acetyltransferase [Dehalococcoidia bacterium]|nr:GNAT family N-acetyltransferase [Dehalococcoidia bacterium]